MDYLRVTDFSAIANITIQFENRDLQFQSKEGVEKAGVHLLGRVYTLSRRLVATFEAPIEIVAAAGMVEQYSRQRSVFQKSLPLAPGKYKLEIAANDVVSGNINRIDVPLDVPRYEEGRLSGGSLILADTIEALPRTSIGGAMFAIGDRKIRPRVGAQFGPSEKMGIYLQVYNLAKPNGIVGYEIDKAGTAEKALEFSEDIAAIPHASATQVTIEKLLPLAGFPPGGYTLKVKIASGGQEYVQQANFSVTP